MRSWKLTVRKSQVNSEKLQFSHCVLRVVLTRTAHERNLELHVKLLENFTEPCQLWYKHCVVEQCVPNMTSAWVSSSGPSGKSTCTVHFLVPFYVAFIVLTGLKIAWMLNCASENRQRKHKCVDGLDTMLTVFELNFYFYILLKWMQKWEI